jgi:hypothetical protein
VGEGYDKRQRLGHRRRRGIRRPEYQDEVESTALYDLLEHEIAPLFYDRGSDGVPREWVRRRSGQRAFTVRVTPRNASFPLNRFETGLIRWFGDEVTTPSRQPQTT